MKHSNSKKISLVIAVILNFLCESAFAQIDQNTRPRILDLNEGDTMRNHVIKADPESGSKRLGVGLQRLNYGQGIFMHKHEMEDEILFIHSGSGVAVAGEQRKSIGAGTTIYIPQGTWHGLNVQSDQMEILWVSSPPHFAENLRDIKKAGVEKISSDQLEKIARMHGYKDAQYYYIPRFTMILLYLGLGALLVSSFSKQNSFRTISIFALGSTLATISTLLTIGIGYVSFVIIALSTILIIASVFIGGYAGIGLRSLVEHVTRKSQ